MSHVDVARAWGSPPPYTGGWMVHFFEVNYTPGWAV